MKRASETIYPPKGLRAKRGSSHVRWLSGPLADAVMAFSWVPFSLAAIAIEGNERVLQALMLYVFFFSFTHQPLTLALVYGDQRRFALRPRLFLWSPLVFAAAVVAALHISPLLLAVAAGLWNAEHTLMQRYGITRIYGRMVGQNQGRTELWMLVAMLILVMVWAAADPSTPQRVSTLGLSGTNRRAFDLLADFRPVAAALLPVTLGALGLIILKWLAEERKRGRNRAKHLYLTSTAALFGVMIIHPIAGYIGYVGAHAFEYFVIVNKSLANQYGPPATGGGLMGKAVRGRWGRSGFFVLYMSLIGAIIVALETAASVFLYSLVFFTLGALHFFYDSFIWKLRQPAVAKSVGAVNRAG